MATAVSARSEAVSVTIASGQSLSAAVNLRGRAVCGVVMPASWSAASLTFQASADGVTFNNVWAQNTAGTMAEVEHEVAASRFVSIPADPFAGATHVRVRSGTAGSPVNQAAERVLSLLVREYW